MSSTHAHRTAPLDATEPVAETPEARAPQRDERGATVLEWALIAAVVVVAASIIAAVIFNIIESKSQDLESCANQPAGSACSR
jgi:Flp pilus assembly pilin Flp